MNEYKIQIGQEQYVNCKEGTKFIDLVGKYYNGKVLDIVSSPVLLTHIKR